MTEALGGFFIALGTGTIVLAILDRTGVWPILRDIFLSTPDR
jgi:hypothetical protein